MASRSEIASQITELIGEGKVRDAYKQFEELPILDQIAVSVSPGVGDVLTAYEVGEFSTRAKENILANKSNEPKTKSDVRNLLKFLIRFFKLKLFFSQIESKLLRS